MSQAARDLDLHENVLRKWVREQVADPGSAFPGHGVMKPESQEIERLRRELARLPLLEIIAERQFGAVVAPIARGRAEPAATDAEARARIDLEPGIDVEPIAAELGAGDAERRCGAAGSSLIDPVIGADPRIRMPQLAYSTLRVLRWSVRAPTPPVSTKPSLRTRV